MSTCEKYPTGIKPVGLTMRRPISRDVPPSLARTQDVSDLANEISLAVSSQSRAGKSSSAQS